MPQPSTVSAPINNTTPDIEDDSSATPSDISESEENEGTFPNFADMAHEVQNISPAQPAMPMRGRRTSVSAESIDPTVAASEHYERVVIHKSDSQRSRIASSVGSNFLFKNLDEEQYSAVIDAMVEKKVHPGDWVILQGSVGDYFYIVETGNLDVYVRRENLTTSVPQPSKAPPPPPDMPNFLPGLKVTDYGPGGSFGELALMYNSPRAASVVATADCVLWALDRVTFRRILLDHTARKRRLYETFLEDVQLLKGLDSYERHKIADNLESVQFNDKDIVIRQGDIGDNFYIIEQGCATVSKFDEKGNEYKMRGLTKGDYFGELALLNDTPRVATIKADGKLKCVTLGKKAFTRLLGPLVDIMKRNEKSYEHYPGEKV